MGGCLGIMQLIKRIAPEPADPNVFLGEGIRNKSRWECTICGDISNFRTKALDHANAHYCDFCHTNLKRSTNLCELCDKIYQASRARFDANIRAVKAMGFQVDFERYFMHSVEFIGHGDIPFTGKVRLSLPAYTGILNWTDLNMLIDYADSRSWNSYAESRHIQLEEGETIAQYFGKMMKIILRQNAQFMIDNWNIVPRVNIPEVISRPPYLVFHVDEIDGVRQECAYNKLQEIDVL